MAALLVSGCNQRAQPGSFELVQFVTQICSDRAHAEDPGGGLGITVVIRVGIDVVSVDGAGTIGDELYPGNANAVVGDEALVTLDDRVPEILHDPEARRRCSWCARRRL